MEMVTSSGESSGFSVVENNELVEVLGGKSWSLGGIDTISGLPSFGLTGSK